MQRLSNHSELRNELKEWLQFLRSECHVLDKHPTLLYTQAANQPDGSPPATAARIKEDRRAWLRWTTKPDTRSAVNMSVSGHRGAVHACLASADGTRIVSASADGTLKLWDADTGAEILVYEGHPGPVTTCSYSPDESIVLSGSDDGTLRFWRAESGEPLPIILQHAAGVRACDWSRQGDRIVSGGEDRVLKLWDAARGTKLRELVGHDGEILSCAFSPDGRLIASGSADKTVRLWDTTSGTLRATLAAHHGEVRACAFSRDGSRLVSGAGFVAAKAMFTFAEVMELAIWDVLSAVSEEKVAPLVMRYPSWAAPGASAAAILSLFDPRVSAATAIAATAQTAKSLATTPDEQLHEGGILAATFAPDGKRVLSASADATLRLWDAATLDYLGTLSGHSQPVNACSWSSSDDLVVSGSEDGTLKVWDVSRASDSSRSPPPRKLEHVSYRISADCRTLATGAAVNQMLGLILLSDIESGEQFGVLTGHEYCAVVTDFSPDCRRLLSRAILRGPPLLWDIPTRKRVATLGPQGEVTHCSFSPDGLHILIAEQTLSLWDAATNREVRKLEGQPSVTLASGFSPDGTECFAVGGDECLRIWDLKSGRLQRTWHGVKGVFGFSPDAKQIICAEADNVVRVRDFKTGTMAVALTDAITPCAFAPDGKKVVAGGPSNSLIVYDARTGFGIATLTGHTDRVASCAFSPDGTRVLSTSTDQTIRIWDVDTEREMARYYLPEKIAIAQWHPGGSSVVIGDSAGGSRTLSLERVVVDAPVVTASHESGNARGLLRRFRSMHFGCPLCRHWGAVPFTALGRKLACPGCGAMLRFNPFVVASDWRSIANAWEAN